MPPKELYVPPTMAEFKVLVEEQEKKFGPLVDRLQLHELVGLSNVTATALAAMRERVRVEAIKKGYRPPGTRIGE